MAFSASPHGLTQVSIMIPLYEHVNMCTHPLLLFFSTTWVKDAVVTSLNQPLQHPIPLIYRIYRCSFTFALVTESKWLPDLL